MSKKSQKGVTLVELILVVGLLSLVTVLGFSGKTLEIEQQRAKSLGTELFQYAGAVRQYLIANPSPSLATRTGTAWLKSGCSGSTGTVAYLNCEFPEGTTANPMYADVSLTSSFNQDPVTGQVTVTINTTPLRVGSGIRPDLAGIAAITASSGTMIYADGASIATFGSFKSSIDDATIEIIVSNTIDGDLWVRTDNPVFKGAASFDPSINAASRVIQNLSKITPKAGEDMTIGLAGRSVIIPGNTDVAGIMRAQTVNASGNITASGNLAGGNVTATGNVTADGTVQGTRYYGATGTTHYLEPGGMSVLSSVTVGDVEATTIRSTDVEASTLRSKSGALKIDGNLAFNGRLNSGDPCSAGEIGVGTGGALTSCHNGEVVSAASWLPQASAGTPPAGNCVPGSFIFVGNDLYVCRG